MQCRRRCRGAFPAVIVFHSGRGVGVIVPVPVFRCGKRVFQAYVCLGVHVSRGGRGSAVG